jgi:hypothetical protein
MALREVLTQYQGNCRAFLHLRRPDYNETVIALPHGLSVAPTRAMVVAIERLFGSGVASFR